MIDCRMENKIYPGFTLFIPVAQVVIISLYPYWMKKPSMANRMCCWCHFAALMENPTTTLHVS